MVENMKAAHVPREAQGEGWGHVQQGSANQQAQLATGPRWGPTHTNTRCHSDIYGWTWLTSPQSSRAPRLDLLSFYPSSSCLPFQVKWAAALFLIAGI